MPLRMRTPLPSLEGAALWINGEPDLDALRDRPVVVQFWSVSCYICHDVVDRVNAWREKFTPQGVAFISIHQPRSEAELDIERVKTDALNEMKIVQPCAIDNEHALVERFENQFVPAYYVFDRSHQLRHFQAGDKGYERIESAIQRVLDEQPAAT
ncbi:MAG TPA: redoxin domain-containing protein [Candidatus Baltobacteraceae bacterium]|nr:redoxin domain-containing protein [Candidatus Baltobacteraceae bacterium]